MPDLDNPLIDTAFHPDITDWMKQMAKAGAPVPTWSRRITGPGQYQLFPLRRRPDTTTADGTPVQVWAVTEDEWSPGEHIEIGPLPADIRIVYELGETYAQRQVPVTPRVEVSW